MTSSWRRDPSSAGTIPYLRRIVAEFSVGVRQYLPLILITEIERAHSGNKRDLCEITVRMVCNQIAPKVIQKINIRMVCNQIAPKVIQINVGPRLTTVSKTNTIFFASLVSRAGSYLVSF